jgi:DNA-binding transcriptional ArsR family regulator/anti-sigma regulatory factor (Ser/Thr protein kinase)
LEKVPRDEIRRLILAELERHPEDIAKVAAEHFGITRQAVHRHLDSLLKDGLIEATGRTRRKRYTLKLEIAKEVLSLKDNRDEDRVWRTVVEPHLLGLSKNVFGICQYGFTEIFNNAIEHSEGSDALVIVGRSAQRVDMLVGDNGVGIFEKIKSRFDLEDHRHAILELVKGKLTTDASRHTGEGIFFTSRMFDRFSISSSKLLFVHDTEFGDDWLIEDEPKEGFGALVEQAMNTVIKMAISTASTRKAQEVFDRYADPEVDDYAFSKTRVPLRLAQYGQDVLVSRSQARRILARFERFREVFLDFSAVESIGQAFADEIFRVYANGHPETRLTAVNANEHVTRMIRRATSGATGNNASGTG